jgi:hypothetical protein
MDSELSRIKLKKFLAKYAYFEEEYQETLYLFALYKKQFEDEIGFKHTKVGSCTDIEVQHIEEEPVEVKVHSMKRIYRELSLKTHPDKKIDHDSTDFMEVHDAYKTDNILKLFHLANKYGVKIDPDEVENLEQRCIESIDQLVAKINQLRTTLIWCWAHADSEQKEALRQHFNL